MVFQRACPLLALLVGPCGCNLFLGVGAALQPYYSEGGLAHDYADRAHATETVGCLDVAVDLAAEAGGRTVLEWRMGNRCNAPVTTDLSRVVVVARRADGSTTTLPFDDPSGEIGPRDLAPRRAALERIALKGASQEVASICVDASRVADHEGGAARPLCFAWSDRWVAGGTS
ncbi:MAG TPA: hypothetical protein VIF09_24875 [Polyangiaceae bacterium]|jgi:hypothetical protein